MQISLYIFKSQSHAADAMAATNTAITTLVRQLFFAPVNKKAGRNKWQQWSVQLNMLTLIFLQAFYLPTNNIAVYVINKPTYFEQQFLQPNNQLAERSRCRSSSGNVVEAGRAQREYPFSSDQLCPALIPL